MIGAKCNILSHFAKTNTIHKISLDVAANLLHDLFLSTYFLLRIQTIRIAFDQLSHHPRKTGLVLKRTRRVEQHLMECQKTFRSPWIIDSDIFEERYSLLSPCQLKSHPFHLRRGRI